MSSEEPSSRTEDEDQQKESKNEKEEEKEKTEEEKQKEREFMYLKAKMRLSLAKMAMNHAYVSPRTKDQEFNSKLKEVEKVQRKSLLRVISPASSMSSHKARKKNPAQFKSVSHKKAKNGQKCQKISNQPKKISKNDQK